MAKKEAKQTEALAEEKKTRTSSRKSAEKKAEPKEEPMQAEESLEYPDDDQEVIGGDT